MKGSAHRGDPQWRVVWMAVGLIVATALLALIVTAVFPSAARAAPSAQITGHNDNTVWSRTQVRVRAGQTASVVLTVSIE